MFQRSPRQPARLRTGIPDFSTVVALALGCAFTTQAASVPVADLINARCELAEPSPTSPRTPRIVAQRPQRDSGPDQVEIRRSASTAARAVAGSFHLTAPGWQAAERPRWIAQMTFDPVPPAHTGKHRYARWVLLGKRSPRPRSFLEQIVLVDLQGDQLVTYDTQERSLGRLRVDAQGRTTFALAADDAGRIHVFNAPGWEQDPTQTQHRISGDEGLRLTEDASPLVWSGSPEAAWVVNSFDVRLTVSQQHPAQLPIAELGRVHALYMMKDCGPDR